MPSIQARHSIDVPTTVHFGRWIFLLRENAQIRKIKGLKHIPAFIESLTDSQIERIPVKFGFIISDYKLASTVLTEQLSMFDDDFLFATSSFMGYGLYDAFIINRNQLNNILSK